MAAFAGQFVPLKLVTDGKREWSQWARRYPIDGNGIPRIYVVRADGEKLFGAVTSLEGDLLPRMMILALRKSGRSFSDSEVALLKSSVAAAEKALAANDYGLAAAEISKLDKLGTLGDFKSYAKPALRADTIAKTVAEASGAMIDEAVAKLDKAETAFTGALALVEAQRQYRGFAHIKSEFATAVNTAKRNKDISPYVAQAEAVVRARGMAESDRMAIRRKAPDAYAAVIRRFPGTEAEQIARTELAAIAPDVKLTTTDAPAKPVMRTWTDRSGKFEIRAVLVKFEDGKVTIKKASGGEIVVPIEKLSEADRDYLRPYNQ